MRLIVFGLYLGFGAMLHALIVGPIFDWSSAWTFGWLFGWPLMLIFTFSAAMIFAGIVIAVVWIGWEWLKTIAHWREKRRARKAKS
jgi:hypothetical protein